MPDVLERLDLGDIGRLAIGDLADVVLKRATIRVLVVVDTEIAISDAGGFGVGRFVRLLRETTLGCTGFRVDVARRSAPPFVDNGTVPAGQARYEGFRFDSTSGAELVLDRYDEIFLFGFKPGNDNGPDANIGQPAAFPASNAELARLTGWMDAGGGVFATGDHDYLGASMCHRIPRVGTMRRWTNAQGVPPRLGTTRLDTNQPATPAQQSGSATIPIGVESDALPQPLEWLPERSSFNGIFWSRRPHEVLCHPQHGPIDVMPDHPHEGACIERDDIDGEATLDFGEGGVAEYPESGGHRELPKVVGYGRVVPDPPFVHDKGDVNPFKIPMIGVYDGHVAGVGRVVTDSTWHHWFNMNLVGLESAPDKKSWEKVARYFVNVAKWIARPGAYRSRCWWEILFSHYLYPGIEEYGGGDRLQIGEALRQRLLGVHGPCTVTELVVATICDLHPRICAYLDERVVPKLPRPDPCLSCPPFDLLERVVLAGFVEGTRDLAENLRSAVDAGRTKGLQLDAADIEAAAMAGAGRALAEFGREVAASAREVAEVFAEAAQLAD